MARRGRVVFGIPRGGVVVAAEVARILGLPARRGRRPQARRALARGVRGRSDRRRRAGGASGAVRAGAVTPEQLAFVEDLERVELRRRQRAFPRSRRRLAGRTAIVVDDGVATGATAMAACLALRAEGAGAHRARRAGGAAELAAGAGAADEYVCPHRMRDFWAVGQFYDDFTQTTDEEVARDCWSARPPRLTSSARERLAERVEADAADVERALVELLDREVRALALLRRRRAAAPRCAGRPCRTAPGRASRGSGSPRTARTRRTC